MPSTLPSGTVFFPRASVEVQGTYAVDRNQTNNLSVNPQRYVFP